MKEKNNEIKRGPKPKVAKVLNSKKAVNAYTKYLSENAGNMHQGFEKIAKALNLNLNTVKNAWYGVSTYKDSRVCRDNIGTVFMLTGRKETFNNRKNVNNG